MKGLAAVFTDGGRPINLVSLEVPELKAGGIRIRNTGAAICGSDLHGWRADGDNPPTGRRMVGGHECSGVIDALGEGVTTDSMGRPLSEWSIPFSFLACGATSACMANCTRAQTVTTHVSRPEVSRSTRSVTGDLHSTGTCRRAISCSKRPTRFQTRYSPR